jgi:hypothetical protein
MTYLINSRQGAGELRRGDDGRLPRDDDVEQHRMHRCIWVGAAIADDDQPIIQIAGVANGRQHDAAGVDTGEHQRVDAVGAQQRLQVGANERADAVLDHDRFPLSCRCGRMDRDAFAPGHQHSVRLQHAEHGVTGADLGMAGRNATTT